MARMTPIGLRSQVRARMRAGIALASAIIIGMLLSTVAAGAAPDEAADLIPAVLAGLSAAQAKGGDGDG